MVGEATSLSKASFESGASGLDLESAVWTLDFRLSTLDSRLRRFHGTLVARGFVRECRNRNVCNCLTLMDHLHASTLAHAANDHGIEIPFAENINNLTFAARVSNDQHAFL